MAMAPLLRDPEATRNALTDWLGGRLEEPSGLCLSPLRQPRTGASSETLLFDAQWRDAEGAHDESLVLRVKPTQHRYYLDDDFDRQRQTLQLLSARTELPVPVIRWHEDDADLLGAPFWIMEHIDGQVPLDEPPYNREGWLADMSPDARHQVWRAAIQAMASVPCSVPVEDLPFLDKPHRGATGLEQQLQFWRESLDWTAEGTDQPVLEDVWSWLIEHAPREEAKELSWGDSRFGNMMFRDRRCVGILDWEMVSLAGGKIDVGWWLWFDFFYSDGEGLARLEGLGNRDETVAVWEETTGRRMDNLDWYEIFGGFRLGVLLVRSIALRMGEGRLTPELEPLTRVNATTVELARRLGLPEPR